MAQDGVLIIAFVIRLAQAFLIGRTDLAMKGGIVLLLMITIATCYSSNRIIRSFRKPFIFLLSLDTICQFIVGWYAIFTLNMIGVWHAVDTTVPTILVLIICAAGYIIARKDNRSVYIFVKYSSVTTALLILALFLPVRIENSKSHCRALEKRVMATADNVTEKDIALFVGDEKGDIVRGIIEKGAPNLSPELRCAIVYWVYFVDPHFFEEGNEVVSTESGERVDEQTEYGKILKQCEAEELYRFKHDLSIDAKRRAGSLPAELVSSCKSKALAGSSVSCSGYGKITTRLAAKCLGELSEFFKTTQDMDAATIIQAPDNDDLYVQMAKWFSPGRFEVMMLAEVGNGKTMPSDIKQKIVNLHQWKVSTDCNLDNFCIYMSASQFDFEGNARTLMAALAAIKINPGDSVTIDTFHWKRP